MPPLETSPVTVPALVAAKGRRKDRDDDGLRRAVGARCSMKRAWTCCWSAIRSRWRSTDSPTLSRRRWTRCVRHARAVSGAARRALVVGDMPFLSYQAGRDRRRRQRRTFSDRGRLRGREGRGRPARARVRRSDSRRRHSRHGPRRLDASVLPQVRRLQGPGPTRQTPREEILEDAVALAEAGCFALVLECVPREPRARDHGDGSRSHDRNRRRTLVRRPGPRSSTMSWAGIDSSNPSSCAATPIFPRRSPTRARHFARDVKDGSFPNEQESFSEAPTLRRCGACTRRQVCD